MRALKKGILLRGLGVTVRVFHRNDTDPSRLAVVVGKKVDASAVHRHRYQRLLREAGRELLTIQSVGYDMVVLALSSFAAQNLNEAARALEPVKKLLTTLHEKS